MRLTPKAKILALLVVAWFLGPEILTLTPVILGIAAGMSVVLLLTTLLDLPLPILHSSRGRQVQQ